MKKFIGRFKKDDKGFTLVEMIVVLVILAILAAILVPALLGYIDEAKEKKYVLHGKSAFTAAQSVASEMYANAADPTSLNGNDENSKKIAKIADLASFANCTSAKVGFAETYNASETDTVKKHNMYTVSYVEYVEDGVTIYYTNGEWTTVAPSTTPTSYTVYTKSSTP